MYDELDLDMLGDERTALFLIMSDTDGTFAFLISLIYSILFNRLCERADDVYGGRLPVHVRCLIDEAANIGQIPNLERLMATIRSREISACLVLQAQSQLKALYKDNMDTIIGKLRKLEEQKTELENTDYVAVARSYKLTPQQLADFLKSQQASPLGEALPQKQEDGNED